MDTNQKEISKKISKVLTNFSEFVEKKNDKKPILNSKKNGSYYQIKLNEVFKKAGDSMNPKYDEALKNIEEITQQQKEELTRANKIDTRLLQKSCPQEKILFKDEDKDKDKYLDPNALREFEDKSQSKSIKTNKEFETFKNSLNNNLKTLEQLKEGFELLQKLAEHDYHLSSKSTHEKDCIKAMIQNLTENKGNKALNNPNQKRRGRALSSSHNYRTPDILKDMEGAIDVDDKRKFREIFTKQLNGLLEEVNSTDFKITGTEEKKKYDDLYKTLLQIRENKLSEIQKNDIVKKFFNIKEFLITKTDYCNLVNSNNMNPIMIYNEKAPTVYNPEEHGDMLDDTSDTEGNKKVFPKTTRNRGFHFKDPKTLMKEALNNLKWALVTYSTKKQLEDGLARMRSTKKVSFDNTAKTIINDLKTKERQQNKAFELSEAKEAAGNIARKKLGDLEESFAAKKSPSKTDKSQAENSDTSFKTPKKTKKRREEFSPTYGSPDSQIIRKKGKRDMLKLKDDQLALEIEALKKRKEQKKVKEDIQKQLKERQRLKEKEKQTVTYSSEEEDDFFGDINNIKHEEIITIEHKSPKSNLEESGEDVSRIMSEIFQGKLSELLKDESEYHLGLSEEKELTAELDSNKRQYFQHKNTRINLTARKISEEKEEFKAEVNTSLSLSQEGQKELRSNIAREVDKDGKVTKITLNISKADFAKSVTYVCLDTKEENKKFYKIEKDNVQIVQENENGYTPCEEEVDIKITVKDGNQVLYSNEENSLDERLDDFDGTDEFGADFVELKNEGENKTPTSKINEKNKKKSNELEQIVGGKPKKKIKTHDNSEEIVEIDEKELKTSTQEKKEDAPGKTKDFRQKEEERKRKEEERKRKEKEEEERVRESLLFTY